MDVIHSMEDHQRDYIDAAVDVVLQVHTMQPPGELRCMHAVVRASCDRTGLH